jgi:hypothetical protein
MKNISFALLMLVACGAASAQDAAPKTDAVAKAKYTQIGTATVSGPAKDCPAEDRGKSATGRASGNNLHDTCTDAKNIARANLRTQVPAACHKYITSTKPCDDGLDAPAK